MIDADRCQRCKLTLGVTRFHFQVVAEPPIPDAEPVTVVLCVSCLESMQRWMARSRKPQTEAGEIGSSEDQRNRDRTSRRSKKRRRTQVSTPSRDSTSGAVFSRHTLTVIWIATLVVLCATAFVVLAANFLASIPGPSEP